MRLTAFMFSVLLPTTAVAEEFQVALPVTEVEAYPTVARVEARADLSLSAGTHDLHVLVPPSVLDAALTVEGAVVLSRATGPNTRFAPADFDIPAQAQARDAERAAALRVEAARRDAAEAKARIVALEASGAFLRSVTGGNTLASPEALAATAAQIGALLTEQAAEISTVRAELTVLEKTVRDAEERLKRASAALEGLAAPTSDWRLTTLSVRLAEPGPVTVTQRFFDQTSRWVTRYDIALSETGPDRISIARSVALNQSGALPWIDARLTLLSGSPINATDAATVGRSIARIFDREARRPVGSAELRTMAEPMMAPEALFDASGAGVPVANLDGPLVRYVLPEPVTLLVAAEAVVSLGALAFEADRFLAASPQFDDTAFVTARFTNESGEPILPGTARLYRGTALVGERVLPLIAAGADATLGFGPEDDIALRRVVLDRQEGDRGLIRGRNTRRDDIRVEVENLGDAPRDVRLRYAVPTSQQEDLVIDTELRPAPTSRDVDNLLGVMEWALSMQPGQTQVITLGLNLTWPEGQELFWDVNAVPR